MGDVRHGRREDAWACPRQPRLPDGNLWLSTLSRTSCASRNARLALGDAAAPGAYGGTGQVGDWPTAAQVATRYPIFLAGGLKPDVYLGQILVARLRPDSTRIQMRAALRDTSGATASESARALLIHRPKAIYAVVLAHGK